MIHLLPLLPLLPTLGLACFTTAAPPVTSGAPEADPAVGPGAGPGTVEAVVGAGFQAIIDPVTGHIVNNPTDAELGRLSEGVAVRERRSAWELREFSLPAGGRGVFLDGWADHSMTVEITAEGEVRAVCSQGDQHTPPTARLETNER